MYEWITTFDREIRLFWSNKGRLVSVLYFANIYGAISFAILQVYTLVLRMMSRVEPGIVCHIFSAPIPIAYGQRVEVGSDDIFVLSPRPDYLSWKL